MTGSPDETKYHPWRAFAAFLLFMTSLLTLFAGSVVTSKNVGLAVPDWPTSYGYHLWAMPFSMWKGGVFYEHVHRVVASVSGCLTLVLAFWLGRREPRAWVRHLAFACLGLVLVQGLLGGITVLLGLPVLVSVLHGVTAQIFLCLTMVLLYALSRGCVARQRTGDPAGYAIFHRKVRVVVVLIFAQLVLAAYMRHGIKQQGGIAIPDFPTMTGQWLPRFDQAAVDWVQAWRREAVMEHDAPLEIGWPVRPGQMVVHFGHRVGAVLIVAALLWLSLQARRKRGVALAGGPLWTLYGINFLVLVEMALGALVVWSIKGALITSLHVLNGALIFVGAVWLAAQTHPIAPLSEAPGHA